jgi:hypothetical protein
MPLTSTIGHHPAADRRNHPGLEKVSEMSLAWEDGLRTLLSLVATARSSAPVVAAATVAYES